VSARLLPLLICKRRLGDERSNARILCCVGEDEELLLDDSKLLARLHEPLMNLGQAALDGALIHDGSLCPRRCRHHSAKQSHCRRDADDDEGACSIGKTKVERLHEGRRSAATRLDCLCQLPGST
jgi:hypothetical protein